MNELSGDGTATEQSLETQISHQLCHYPQEVSSPHPWQQSQLQGSDREDCPQSSDMRGHVQRWCTGRFSAEQFLSG